MWAIYAIVGANIVESAYKGESFEILNRVIQRQDAYPLEHYQVSARNFLAAISIAVLTLVVLSSCAHYIVRRGLERQIVSIRNSRSIWFRVLVAMALSFVFLTFAQRVGITSDVPFFSLSLFDVTLENNFGAWFSGTLLLFGAMHAFDGFVHERSARSRAALAWLVVTAILLLLSLDEVGSLHERADNNIAPLMGKSIPLLPFGIIIVSLLGIAFLSLWNIKEYKRQVVGLVIGCGVLATIPFQEYLEHTVNWGTSRWTSASRAIIEEGSELLGMLIILKACIPNSKGIFQAGLAVPKPMLAMADRWPRLIVLGTGVLLIPIFTLFSAFIDEAKHRGYPASWLASALFLFAAISAVRDFLEHGRPPKRVDVLMAALCIVASIGIVSVPVQHRIHISDLFDISGRMIFLLTIGIAITVTGYYRLSRRPWIWLFAMLSVIVATVAFVQSENLVALFGIPCVLALVTHNRQLFSVEALASTRDR